MMIYYIKQKRRLRYSFSVLNAQQEEIYQVKSKFLSFDNRLAVMDVNKTPLMHIRQKITPLKKIYFIEQNGRTIAEVAKQIVSSREIVDLKPFYWTLTGDFLAGDYILENEGGVLMEVHKKRLPGRGSYELQIADIKDLLVNIAVLIILDIVSREVKGPAVRVLP